MTRGIGEFAPIQDVIPEWAAILVALVTQLGDVWFLALLVGAIYWYRTDAREDVAVVTGLALSGFALITALKHVFAFPRPDRPLVELESLPWLLQPLYELTGTASGYGFPSGHAVITTIVYFCLAVRLSIGTFRQRVLAASTVVAAVALSRVALGVHYLADVVAGVVVGFAFLFVAERLFARYPTDQRTVAFSIAIVAGILALVASNVDPDAVLILGASLGAFGGQRFVRRIRGRSSA